MTIFDYLYEDFRFEKDKPIRVVELFSGIGFQSMGMELAEVPYEVVAISEIDKFAILSYASIHTDYLKTRDDYDFRLSKDEMVEALQSKNVGYNFSSGRHTITKNTNIETVKDYFLADKLSNNLGDISLLKGSDFPKDIDIMTYSFPCQDLSKAGQQKGLGGQQKGLSEGTRSGLVYEVLRILQELKEINNLPKVPIMENVVDLIQVKFIDAWNKIAYEIERLGYTNYTQTLNAKNYGIAQNRDRVFMVSILGEYNYNFPRGFELEHRLKNYLEDEVDDKYYLSDKMLNFFIENSKNNEEKGNRFRFKPTNGDYEAKCITTNTGSRMDDNFIKIPEATKKGYAEAYDGVVVGSYGYGSSDSFMGEKSRLVKDPDVSNTIITSPNVGVAIKKIGNIYPSGGQNGKVFGTKGISPTITTGSDSTKVLNNLRIRKLTPVETGRLMGMNDEQIDKQLEVVSNSQAYKQHGNGIVAQVIGLIIGMMVYEDENELRETVMKNSHTWLK